MAGARGGADPRRAHPDRAHHAADPRRAGDALSVQAAAWSEHEERIARKAASKLARRYGLPDREDLEQEARLAVWRAREPAACHENPDAYRTLRARRAMIDAVRSGSLVGRTDHARGVRVYLQETLPNRAAPPAESDPVLRVALERAPRESVEAILLLGERGASRSLARRLGLTESAISYRRAVAGRAIQRALRRAPQPIQPEAKPDATRSCGTAAGAPLPAPERSLEDARRVVRAALAEHRRLLRELRRATRRAARAGERATPRRPGRAHWQAEVTRLSAEISAMEAAGAVAVLMTPGRRVPID